MILVYIEKICQKNKKITHNETEERNIIQDIKEDSFKYDWDWIKDVGEYILNDPFMQSHRGREYAIKIGLIKEDCPSCANIDSIYEGKK